MNRRAAITAAVALAAAPRALAADGADQEPTDILPPAAAHEQAFWAVCDQTLRIGTLRGGDPRVLRRLRARGDENATAVEAALESLGATPPPRPTRKLEVPLPGFHEASTRADHLRFAEVAAQGAVSAWQTALQQLRQPELLRLGAAAVASHGQHLVVVRGLLGADRLPLAFETGRRG